MKTVIDTDNNDNNIWYLQDKIRSRLACQRKDREISFSPVSLTTDKEG